MPTATKANEKREEAAAAFKAASDYLKGVGKDDANDLSPEEMAGFQEKLKTAKDLDAEYVKMAEGEDANDTLRDRLDYYHGKASGTGLRMQPIISGYREKQQSLGDLFVGSPAYKALKDSGALKSANAQFRTDPVFWESKVAATDLIHTNSGGPTNVLVRPEYRPGIIELPERPLVVRDLFANANTESETLIYARQTSRSSGVAAVGQAATVNTDTLAGGRKPQSSIAFEEDTISAKNVATWMVVTRQTLEDAPVVRSLIDNQGRLMLDVYVDDQLMNGNGTGPNIKGLLAYDDLQTLDLTDVDNLDGIRTARRLVMTGSARVPADGIVLNPVDSEEFDLLKDGNGQYRGGNPIGNYPFNQPIWSLRRVESEAIAPGKAIVGAFRFGATVLQRSPVAVFTTDSHSDFFIRNLIVVLFEERLMFPVWWPEAFVEIDLDDWGVASGS